MENQQAQLDPHKTMLVIKHDGREVGRIAATARNASAYVQELASYYKQVEIDYVHDEDAGLFAMLNNALNTSL